MGRSPDGAAARDVVVGVRMTRAGLAALDKARGPVSRSTYIRALIAKDVKEKQR